MLHGISKTGAGAAAGQRWLGLILSTVSLIFLVVFPALRAEGQPLSITSLDIEAGHSRLVNLPSPIKRVSVGNEEVADVVVISADQIYVNGRKVGSTNITLWGAKEEVMGVVKIKVGRDLTKLKEHLHDLFPNEEIEARELEGAVVLSGRVSSLEIKAKAEKVAQALVGEKGGLANLMEVGGNQQVMIQVRFAEISSKVIKRLGVNLGFVDEGGFFFTLLGGLSKPFNLEFIDGGLNFDLSIADTLGGFGSFTIDGNRFFGFLDALKENGMAKLLAEPNLVTTSGQEADFLAGGEFPIPVPQNDRVTIEFKKYGVQLKFKPEVTAKGKIRLEVSPEVSELDFSTAVVIEGFAVPGLTTRRAKTQLELEDGQSFVMAGLLKDTLTEVVSKVPLLGDIPILGALFRSTSYQKGKTELVILVTPKIIKPGEGTPDKWPTKGLKEPGDLAFYLLGSMVERDKEEHSLPLSLQELEGEFGHDLAY